MRLDKYLWELGTRTEIKKLLKTGAVQVDGQIVKDGGTQVNENSDVVYMGKKHIYREFVYLVMNKPKGVVCATRDNHLPVVTDIIDEQYKKFQAFPVGRLDIDTEGLLILTNDGPLCHDLTSPKKKLYKKYLAITQPAMEPADAEKFLSGIDLGDFVTMPGNLEFTSTPEQVVVTICEGKFHQVKRMCEKCGKTVTYLKRISIGDFSIPDNMKPGDVIEMTKQELLDLIYSQTQEK